MKNESTMKALRRFNKACDKMITAEILLGAETRVDFNGVYIEIYKARELTRKWLETLENKNHE